jgi:hypothetical protein
MYENNEETLRPEKYEADSRAQMVGCDGDSPASCRKQRCRDRCKFS